MLEIEEPSFNLGRYGKLPNAELITWFGENCIDLKQQTNSGHGQRVSDREKKSEITAKETIAQLKKAHRATVAQLKKEHKATVTKLKKEHKEALSACEAQIKELKSNNAHLMPTYSICYLVGPQKRKANPNKVIRSSKIKVKIPHDSRPNANVVISQEPRGMAEGSTKTCRLRTLNSTFRRMSNIAPPASYHSNCIRVLTIVM